MVTENPSWGAPRIHGELLMLGFDVSERTISRWMKRVSTNPDPAKRWLAFLRNHPPSLWIVQQLREAFPIAINEDHVKRLLTEYIRYHNGVSYCPTSLCG
jgi:hypothetical protein